MSERDLHAERRDYAGALRRADLAADPLEQFQRWLDEALALDIRDATAFTLATAAPDAVPSARIVLLKAFDAEGYVFYSDYRSQKGSELSANPVAAMLFHWRELDRQVRLTGVVSQLPEEASRAYFATRPADSRFAAAASEQSAAIADRAALEARVDALKAAHPDGGVAAPERWGGYRLKPERYEFWQGREGRLHDRFRYRRGGDGPRSSAGWTVERLQP